MDRLRSQVANRERSPGLPSLEREGLSAEGWAPPAPPGSRPARELSEDPEQSASYSSSPGPSPGNSRPAGRSIASAYVGPPYETQTKDLDQEDEPPYHRLSGSFATIDPRAATLMLEPGAAAALEDPTHMFEQVDWEESQAPWAPEPTGTHELYPPAPAEPRDHGLPASDAWLAGRSSARTSDLGAGDPPRTWEKPYPHRGPPSHPTARHAGRSEVGAEEVMARANQDRTQRLPPPLRSRSPVSAPPAPEPEPDSSMWPSPPRPAWEGSEQDSPLADGHEEEEGPPRGFLGIDGTAWALGLAALVITGIVTSGAAAVVWFAMTLN